MEKVPVEKRKNNLFLVAYLILLLVLLCSYVGEYIVALVASSIKPEVETADMSTQQSASSLSSPSSFFFFPVKHRLYPLAQSSSPYSAPRSEKQVPFYR